MKTLFTTVCLMCCVCLVLGGFSQEVTAAGDGQEQPSKKSSSKVSNATKDQGLEEESSEKGIIYRPPQRGAPMGRIAGGTRGPADEIPFICALVPEHVGLTQMSDPNLYWYISEPSKLKVVLTVNSEDSTLPLLETVLDSPTQEGIQTIKLSNYEISLEKGQTYTWYVALVPDPKNRSKDLLTRGGIKRIPLTREVRRILKGQSAEQKAMTCADQGLWYDALQELMSLANAGPGDSAALQQLKSLLKQANLPEAIAVE